jgi:anti-anti-sigma factor
MDLEIGVRLTPPLAELTLKGELDFSSTQRVDWAVGLAASASGCSLVAVDLQDVTFIDCAGIRTLVEARHRLDAACSQLWISGLSPQVSRLMRLTGTDSLFGVSDLVAQAG